MPRRHEDKRVAESEPKGKPRFYLITGSDHASDCTKGHTVAIRGRDGVNTCDVGLPARAFQWGVGHVQREIHDRRATVARYGGDCQCPGVQPGTVTELRSMLPAVAATDRCIIEALYRTPACSDVCTTVAGTIATSDRRIARALHAALPVPQQQEMSPLKTGTSPDSSPAPQPSSFRFRCRSSIFSHGYNRQQRGVEAAGGPWPST